ncbi:MAG: FkbM family methyltransferase [Planctomycetota bacterium]
MILRRILEKREHGFYVDVGAHHPKRFSNTYHFYRNGWRGINIDAMPGSMKAFNKIRPRDINLEMAVSSRRQKLVYYAFDDPALNSFSEKLSLERNGKNGNKIIFTKERETLTLREILDTYVPKGTQIDFLSVDAEGLDFEVLQSGDWNKYRPAIVLVEAKGNSLESATQTDVYRFLLDKGYALFAKTVNTLIFAIDQPMNVR